MRTLEFPTIALRGNAIYVAWNDGASGHGCTGGTGGLLVPMPRPPARLTAVGHRHLIGP